MRDIPYIVVCLLTLTQSFIFGQNDSLNKINKRDKKTGYRKIYLDQNAMPTDSANSYFFGFEFYDNGKRTFPAFFKSSLKNQKVIFDGITPEKGHPIPISGVLRIYRMQKDTIEFILFENSYINGYPQTYIEFFFGKEPSTVIDFTKKHNNIDGSYFMTDYYSHFFATEKNKVKTYWWYTKVENKWKFISAKPQLEK